MNAITPEQLAAFRKAYDSDPVQGAVRRALYKTDVMTLATCQENEQRMQQRFSVDIKTMPATSQGQSGRCWIFAGLNVLREEVAKKLNLEKFELSQNYTAFYDKLEKINFFLESVIELRDREWDDRTLWWILQSGVSDGGQWNMLTATIKKYGVAPKDAMPESFHSSHTRDMNKLLNTRLRRFAVDVKAAAEEEIPALKENALGDCYTFLCSCFGVPPKSFDFEYVDKDKNYHLDRDLTPQAFYDKYVGLDLDQYVSLIHSPTQDKPYYGRYTISYLGSEVSTPVTHLNLPMDELKAAVRKQLEDGAVVWFGSDCSNFINRPLGVWDAASYDLKALFPAVDFSLDKEHTLYTRDGAMNHAMVLTGVNIVDGKPTKWKIENSWGEDLGVKGYYVCSDAWFESFVYQAVVNKKYLSPKALAALESTPVMVAPWDPMGTLAD